MNTKDIIDQSNEYLMNTYARYPYAFVRGEDCKLIDTEGRVFTDFLSGIAVSSLGYSNEAVKKAIRDQANLLCHSSNLFYIENQTKLAKILCEHSFADQAFICNSGAEANEGAVKLARKTAYHHYGPQKHKVIAMTKAFHGRTIATLSITANKKYREGYGPEPKGFAFSPFNDLQTLTKLMDDDTAAVIMEPIQGEGGVTPATKEFLEGARKLCDQYHAALIFDEVQCGMGRSGKLFAYENYDVQPDILTLAKALGNGVPIGAVLAKRAFSTSFHPGAHGTTFGGNHLATAASVAVLTEMLEKNIPQLAKETGAYFIEEMVKLQSRYTFINDVRGMGLILGMELSFPGKDIVRQMLERGFIINCTENTVLRFLPPLIISKEEIDAMLLALTQVFDSLED